MLARPGTTRDARPLSVATMNITLKQLRVFCALYELRSFTAAARATRSKFL